MKTSGEFIGHSKHEVAGVRREGLEDIRVKQEVCYTKEQKAWKIYLVLDLI